MRPTVPATDENRPRVLLVEPDAAVRAVVGQLLTDAGCEVITAPNLAQGIVGARRERPDVIVTEVRGGTVLPPGAYVEALTRLSPAPVIAHTEPLPTAGEIDAWRVWAGVVKGDAARLLEVVHRAHSAIRAGTGR
jgi:DNA-binding NtrC family response regulator